MTSSPSHPIRLLLALGLAAALSASLLAQQSNLPPWHRPNQPDLEDAPWFGSLVGPAADLVSVELADMDGDGLLDALVQCGDSLVSMLEYPDHTLPLEVHVGGVALADVSAFCLLERAAGSPLLIVSTDSGVQALEHVGDGDYAVFAPFGNHTTDWEDCQRLIAADHDGDGHLDVWGLAAGGLRVHTITQDPSGTWAAGPGFTLEFEAQDFTPIHWDDPSVEPTRELAYAADDGVRVLDAGTSTPVYQRLSALDSEGAVEALDDGSGKRDRLAWLAHLPSASISVLSVLQEGEEETHVLTPAIPYTPATLLSEDLDGDGDDDLLITWEDEHDLAALRHEQGGAARFDPGTVHWLNATPSWPSAATGHTARAAVADLTGDGRVDIAIPSQARNAITTRYGPALPDTTWVVRPMIVEGTSAACLFHEEVAVNGPGDGDGDGLVDGSGYVKLTFRVEFPSNAPGNAWRIGIWHQGQSSQRLEADALCISTLDMAATQPDATIPQYDLVAYLPPDDTWSAATEAEYLSAWNDDERVFHLQIWPIDSPDTVIDHDSTGLRMWSSLLASATYDAGALPSIPLDDDWVDGDGYQVLLNCDDLPYGETAIGGFAFAKRLPPPLPGTPLSTNGACLDALHALNP